MLQAIILGLVQGLTEFLPVSSSGHLVVVPYLMGWPSPGLTFDVALHGGTLLAVVAYFAGDLWYLATRSLGIGVAVEGEAGRARRTIALLAIGTVPAAVVGYVLEDFFADTFERPRLVAGFLLVTAAMLWGAERLRERRLRNAIGGAGPHHDETDQLDVGRDESTVGWTDSVTIGIAQAIAIFPGISRSGSTIVAGMVRGLSREGATRFSFLLAIPVIAGATVFQLSSLAGGSASSRFTTPEILVGVAAAAVSGYWAIRFLLRLVQTDDLTGFARYVALFGILTFVGTLWIGPPSQI